MPSGAEIVFFWGIVRYGLSSLKGLKKNSEAIFQQDIAKE